MSQAPAAEAASLRVAALPMYDFPELRRAHDALWTALAERLIALGLTEVPRKLTYNLGHHEVWRHPRLLFAQACEYPLATSFAGCARMVATPCYRAPGCEGSSYRSALIVRSEDPADSLASLRQRRCVINEATSNSGMNLLRAAVAPLAGGRNFFQSVALSGAHRKSAKAVSEGAADVTAIDCVTWAHLERLYPAEVVGLRVLGWTAPSPSLPFITSASADDALLQSLRLALADVMADTRLSRVREVLLLSGVDIQPDPNLTEVRRLAEQAAADGLPMLA